MSLSKLEEIRCPCGEVFEAELWNAINSSEDPELKDALLNGEINVVCCPACGEIFYAEHFLLYHDADSELLAFVYPSSFAPHASYWAGKMEDDFRRAMEEMTQETKITYKPILLFGLDSLVSLIHEDEEESDEVTILEYIAKDLELSLVHLHPALARPHQLLRVLPRLPRKKGALRDEVIDGLRRLLEYNKNLSRYRKLLGDIENDSHWTLDNTIVKAGKK